MLVGVGGGGGVEDLEAIAQNDQVLASLGASFGIHGTTNFLFEGRRPDRAKATSDLH
jgi:hypothetical protein